MRQTWHPSASWELPYHSGAARCRGLLWQRVLRSRWLHLPSFTSGKSQPVQPTRCAGSGAYEKAATVIARLATVASLVMLGVANLPVPSASAQTGGTGALTVTVIDSSGAVVPGASVTVRNGAGITRTNATDTDGSYTFTLLPPGLYDVLITSSGFKTAKTPSVAVDVAETHVLPEKLEIGTQTQQVMVSGQAEVIETESSTLGTVIDSNDITTLPLVTRNFTQIASLSPGVTANVYNASALGRGGLDWSVNGMDPNTNNVLMEGSSISNMTTGQNSNPVGFYGDIATPSPDAIQEFKVQTSLFDAAYGRQAGGNVNVILKSGTNQIHGTLFEYVRNDIFNANDFFLNRAGEPRGVLKQNQFGGTIGGPIKKDKLFLFLSYQGTRQLNGVSVQGLQVPLLPVQLSNNRSAAALGAAFCPANNPVGTSGHAFSLTFNPTPGGVNPPTDQVACNGSNINTVALTILNAKLPNGPYIIPTPTSLVGNPGSQIGEAVLSSPSSFDEDQAVGSLDWTISSKNTLAWRYFYSFAPEIRTFNNSPCTWGCGMRSASGNQFTNMKWASIVSTNLVNEARLSYYYIRAFVNTTDPFTHANLGIQNYAINNWIDRGPIITVNGLFTQGGATVDGAHSPQTILEWADQFSWNRGRNTMRIGYDELQTSWPIINYYQNRGSLTFQSFPDFLLGENATQNGTSSCTTQCVRLSNIYASGGAQTPVGGQYRDLRTRNFSAYFQDDIKVNRRLTVNAGIRWEYNGYAYEKNGNNVNYWLHIAQQVPVPPSTGTLAGYTEANNYPGVLPVGVYRRYTNDQTQNGAPLHDFGPRIGFAWQPLGNNSSLVLRGGAGIFYSQIHISFMGTTNSNNPPQTASQGFTGVPNAAATWQVPWTANTTLGFPTFTRLPRTAFTALAVDPFLIVPHTFSYHLDLQYALRPSWVLQLSYVGARGEHLWATQAHNIPVLVQPGAAGINNLPSPQPGVNCANVVANGGTGCVLTNTAGNAIQRVPIVGLAPGGVLELLDNVGDSTYNSGQVTVRKTLSHGLTFQVAYTYSRTITDISGVESERSVNYGLPYDRSDQRGPADFSRSNRVIANYIYDFPSFRQNQGFTGRALSGWGVAGVTTIQSGLPMTLTDPRGGAVYGAVTTSGAELCPGFTKGQIISPGNIESKLNHYFNLNALADTSATATSTTCTLPIVGAFPPPGPGLPASPGATGFGNLKRAIVYGPGQNNWDFSAIKHTRVGGLSENADLEFRAEFYNAFNHSQFNNPATAVGITSTSFGKVTSTSVAPRIIQLALRYSF